MSNILLLLTPKLFSKIVFDWDYRFFFVNTWFKLFSGWKSINATNAIALYSDIYMLNYELT